MMCDWLARAATENQLIAGIVGALWSAIVEYAIPGWKDVSFERKRWIVLALCLAVPLVALVAGAYGFACADMAVTPSSVVLAITQGGIAFSVSQMAHLRLKKREGELD